MTHWKLTTLRKKSLVSISGKLFDFDRAFSNWDDGDSGCLEWSSQKKGALYWEGELSFRLKIVRTNSQVQTPVGGDLGDGTAQGSLATLPIGHLRPYPLETQKPVTCDPTSFYYLGHAKLDLVTCDPTHPNKGKHKAVTCDPTGSQTTATKLEKDNPNSNSPNRDWQAVSSQDWFWPLSMLATINQSVSKILFCRKKLLFLKICHVHRTNVYLVRKYLQLQSTASSA